MKSEQPLEKGTGDWGRYADSQYAAAMNSTRKFVLKELASRDFYLPCEAISAEVHKVSLRPPQASQKRFLVPHVRSKTQRSSPQLDKFLCATRGERSERLYAVWSC